MPEPIMEAGERQFDPAARDAARMATQQPSQQIAPQQVIPGYSSGEPAFVPGQPSPVHPATAAAFGLQQPAPIQQPPMQQPMPQQFAPQQQQFNPMSAFTPGQQIPLPPQPQVPPVGQPQQQPNPLQTPEALMQGQQHAENYAALIQRNAEEAYAYAVYRAKNEPTYIETLVNSQDALERQLAKKVLERNSEHFGAGTVEEYQAKKAVEAAGTDPQAREIAQLKLDQARTNQTLRENEWKTWKSEQGIKKESEFDKLCDAVRKDYPTMANSDVIHTARGRAGINPQKYITPEGAGDSPGGSRGAPPEGQQVSHDAARIFQLDPGMQQSAEQYFQGIGGGR